MKKILCIQSGTRGVPHVALPYTTDEDALKAWNWLVASGRLRDVHDRPGEDPGTVRLLMHRYLEGGEHLPALDGETARLFISSLYGAELYALVMDLVEP